MKKQPKTPAPDLQHLKELRAKYAGAVAKFDGHRAYVARKRAAVSMMLELRDAGAIAALLRVAELYAGEDPLIDPLAQGAEARWHLEQLNKEIAALEGRTP